MRDLSDEQLLKASTSLATQIRKKVEDVGANGVVLGLSGGIDSAVVCAICSKVVDTKVMMLPDDSISTKEDLEDSIKLSEKLGVAYDIIDIHKVARDVLDSYPSNISPGSIADMNIRPRLRMLYLYLCANDEQRLVAGTSNHTEIELGYCTKWGDNAADFLPIASLWKTEVIRLGRLLKLPNEIVNKKPSAGLYFGQTDEGDLGATYDVLDAIIYEHTVGSSTRSELYKTYGKELVNSILSLMERNRHKRTMPPSLEFVL